MTVTKQQQLKWLAKKYKTWPEQGATSLGLSVTEVGKFAVVNCYLITRQEWQQERDKMQKQAAQPAQDNSWHERGEFPPAGCECEVFVNVENKWMHFEVIAIRDGHILGWCRESSCGFQSNKKSEFRPLCTEREKAINEMYQAAFSIGSEINAETIGAIYDAGYRKVKP